MTKNLQGLHFWSLLPLCSWFNLPCLPYLTQRILALIILYRTLTVAVTPRLADSREERMVAAEATCANSVCQRRHSPEVPGGEIVRDWDERRWAQYQCIICERKKWTRKRKIKRNLVSPIYIKEREGTKSILNLKLSTVPSFKFQFHHTFLNRKTSS